MSTCICGAIIAHLLTSGFSRALPRRGHPAEREIRVECHTTNEDFWLELVVIFVLVIVFDALTSSSLYPHHFREGASLCGLETLLVAQKVPLLVASVQEIIFNECDDWGVQCNDWGVQPGRPTGPSTRAG